MFLKGVNELRLNEASVQEALEEYINARLFAAEDNIEVTSVSEGNGVPKSFVVKIKSADRKESK